MSKYFITYVLCNCHIFHNTLGEFTTMINVSNIKKYSLCSFIKIVKRDPKVHSAKYDMVMNKSE